MAKICHLGAWGENWGDRAIQYALQKAIGTEQGWRDFNIQEPGDYGQAWLFGKADLVLIGGGGLLWDKPELNSQSGWQWDISVEEIKKLEMPVVVHSIGLTKFPYGDTTGEKPEYWDTLGALLEKAELFSVRNEMTRDHLIEGGLDGSKITVCPDPALFLGEPAREKPDGRPILGVCLAWDKTDWRWPGRYGGAASMTEFMDALSNALGALVKESNWRLRAFCHLPYDRIRTITLCRDALWCVGKPQSDMETAADWCIGNFPALPVHIRSLANAYGYCSAVVSMRKHGLLIPAGLGVPVVGLGDMAEVGAICEQLGADCVRSEDATPEAFTEAVHLAQPISPTRLEGMRKMYDWHIAQIQELLA